MATFLYDHLRRSRNLNLNYLPTPWLESLPFPSEFGLMDMRSFLKNGYLLPGDMIAAARAGDKSLIVFGKGRPEEIRKVSPGSEAFSKWAIDHLAVAAFADQTYTTHRTHFPPK